MPEKNTQSSTQVPIDLDKCMRLSKKVIDLLQKKTKSLAEAYFAVRLVGIFLEEKIGIRMTSDQEKQLRQFVQENEEEDDEDL
jgi:hypothetical protein